MIELNVALDSCSYPIYIESGLTGSISFKDHIAAFNECVVVTNETIAGLYWARLNGSTFPEHTRLITLPDGEQYKTLETWGAILTQLLEWRLSRNVVLVALGGGVVGDITGFAAACYQRGVRFVQVPTTLLAMVDSSVGGKTAVNHALGKNMIGAFYQPESVWVDPDMLRTLPEREFLAGLAEVVKYGFISDSGFLQLLNTSADSVLKKQPEVLQHMIAHCCRLKADVVAEDEQEQGVRAILNFGHTFGHAIEKVLGFGQVLHGEAVAIGMRLALILSEQLGLLSADKKVAGLAVLSALGLPQYIETACDVEALYQAMEQDKKKTSTALRFIVLEDLGRATIVSVKDKSLIISVLNQAFKGEGL